MLALSAIHGHRRAIFFINYFKLNSFFFCAGTGNEVVPATSKVPARLVFINLHINSSI